MIFIIFHHLALCAFVTTAGKGGPQKNNVFVTNRQQSSHFLKTQFGGCALRKLAKRVADGKVWSRPTHRSFRGCKRLWHRAPLNATRNIFRQKSWIFRRKVGFRWLQRTEPSSGPPLHAGNFHPVSGSAAPLTPIENVSTSSLFHDFGSLRTCLGRLLCGGGGPCIFPLFPIQSNDLS